MLGLTNLGKAVVALVLLVCAAVVALYITATPAQAPVACTTEAKLCPDGSAVGRTGPNCEFAACPVSASSTPTSTATSTSGGGGGGNFAKYTSGIKGTVLAGPTCPVERNPPDPACADKPLAITVSFSRKSDPLRVVATVLSNKQGEFTASLPPGVYMVEAGTSGTMLPRCTPAEATVGATGYTVVAISCDTGIR